MASEDKDLENTVTTTLSLELRRRTDGNPFTLPALRVVAGPDMLRFCSVYPDEEVVIGREDGCDLVLHDASISRRHATVTTDAEGAVFLRDLGSTNGTARNGERIGREPVRIMVGDQIDVGSVTLRLDRLSLDELAHLARVVERLNLANKDPLTGLATRRWLDEELDAILVRHRHARLPVTLVFVDIDHFKRVNDTWGHAVGDEVLRSVARVLALAVRDSDTVVRYGGEELIVVLPNCDEAGGRASAERMRNAVAAHDWGHHAERLHVTISLGVATCDERDDVRTWIERADRALYAAKGAGRDRVVAASQLG